jgi:hypothetical protein
VFGIVWLRGGVPIERETSVLTNESEAIAAAESHVTAVSRSRHHQPEPRLGGVPIDRPVALFRRRSRLNESRRELFAHS